jgi:hypothetical protein
MSTYGVWCTQVRICRDSPSVDEEIGIVAARLWARSTAKFTSTKQKSCGVSSAENQSSTLATASSNQSSTSTTALSNVLLVSSPLQSRSLLVGAICGGIIAALLFAGLIALALCYERGDRSLSENQKVSNTTIGNRDFL